MAPSDKPLVRDAGHDDVVAICRFGEVHIRQHYAPLIGAAAADEQVRRWWNETHIGAVVADGLVVIAGRPAGNSPVSGSAGAKVSITWSTSSTSTPVIAAVGWAHGYSTRSQSTARQR